MLVFNEMFPKLVITYSLIELICIKKSILTELNFINKNSNLIQCNSNKYFQQNEMAILNLKENLYFILNLI